MGWSSVSIPGRDLGVLEHHSQNRRIDLNFCFNPWKGFGGFGTVGILRSKELVGVSIPGRDLGVLEPNCSLSTTKKESVSIPGRDLGVLERKFS